MFFFECPVLYYFLVYSTLYYFIFRVFNETESKEWELQRVRLF